MKKILIVLLAALTLLSGCGKTEIVYVYVTPEPTAEHTPEPTPVPTPDPTPEPTPKPIVYRDAAVVAELISELIDGSATLTVYDEKTDPNGNIGKLGMYSSKARFDYNGKWIDIEAFPEGELDHAEARATYLDSFVGTKFGDYVVYRWGEAIVRFSNNHTLDEIEPIIDMLDAEYPGIREK